jgi:zinc transporter ZupT
MILTAFISALILAGIHIFANKLKFLQVIPRSRWLSFSSGISVSYIFVHLLPELKEWQMTFEQYTLYLSHHLYLMALLGLVTFYGLERAVKLAKPKIEEEPPPGIFWIHILSFTLYNCLVGYLLINREESTVLSLVFFSLAMAAHFLVNDYGLYQHHRKLYIRKGRWLVSAGIGAGFGVGLITHISDPVLALFFAFLAGGVILNVLKEELPEERKSRYLPFLLGAALYAVILLAI